MSFPLSTQRETEISYSSFPIGFHLEARGELFCNHAAYQTNKVALSLKSHCGKQRLKQKHDDDDRRLYGTESIYHPKKFVNMRRCLAPFIPTLLRKHVWPWPMPHNDARHPEILDVLFLRALTTRLSTGHFLLGSTPFTHCPKHI